MMKFKYIAISLLAVGLFSCKPEMKESFEPNKGSVDFSTYIALGNSLTAGYADGALYHSAQKLSYVSIMAGKLSEVGGGEFIQPVVNSEQGVLPGKLTLAVVNGNLTPVPAQDGELDPFYPPIDYAVHNLGVPGAKVLHLLAPGYGKFENVALGLANPYFVRFASSPDISVIEQAVNMNPTFFSLWIGNNDVLGYASNGGVKDMITPIGQFTTYYDLLVKSLNNTGAKGVLATIPSVKSAAFFNTIPGNGLPLNSITAEALNGGIALVEQKVNMILSMAGLPAFSYGINFTSGNNAFLIEDKNFLYKDLFNAIADTSTDMFAKIFLKQAQFRQLSLQDNELITLKTPQDSLAMGMGSFMEIAGHMVPFGIPDRYILEKDEIENIDQAVTAFNDVIKSFATQYDWALVDINSKFNEMKDGVIIDGIELSAEYVKGGIFSLDGIHLTPRGNAVVSNFFIEAINKQYGASISTVNIGAYPAIEFPNE